MFCRFVVDVIDSAENLLPEKFSFHPNVLAKLYGTGFENLMKLRRPSKHNLALITAVVETCSISQRCFVFGEDTKLFMGLGNVLRITGLPIDGLSIIGNEKEVDLKKLCEDCLGTDECLSTRSEISLTWMRTKFGKLNAEVAFEGEELDRYVRAPVLYIIGSIILPTNSSRVAPFYLTFLKNVDDIKSYA